jgi:hypothetical protein
MVWTKGREILQGGGESGRPAVVQEKEFKTHLRTVV